MKVINAFKLQHFINTSGQGENIKVMKKVIKTEEFSYHENIAKLKKLLQRRENTNIPMKNLLQELKAPPVHHEGKRCPPTCNQQKKCQYIRKVFIEKIKTPTSLQRLSSCDPPALENKIFMYNINITYNISLSVFCNSRSCKRREILFQKSWLLFLTWREYFYSQPTHFSSQPKKSGYKQSFSPFTKPCSNCCNRFRKQKLQA